MIAFVICSVVLLDCRWWIRSIPTTTAQAILGRAASSWFSTRQQQADLTRRAVLQARCTRAMLRDALPSTRASLLWKSPFWKHQQAAKTQAGHLPCVVRGTKGCVSLEDLNPYRYTGYFGGCNFTPCVWKVTLEAGLSQVLLAQWYVAGKTGLLHSHKAPRTSSRSGGTVQWCGPSVADP